MSALSPFHLAIPVTCLTLTTDFYGNLLGCTQGRSSERWIDWNLFGHQVVTHLVAAMPEPAKHNQVDGKAVPVPHFGVVLPWQDWQRLGDRLTAHQHPFIIKPGVRFAGQTGEQGTFFFADPFGNALEFKALRDPQQLFAP